MQLYPKVKFTDSCKKISGIFSEVFGKFSENVSAILVFSLFFSYFETNREKKTKLSLIFPWLSNKKLSLFPFSWISIFLLIPKSSKKLNNSWEKALGSFFFHLLLHRCEAWYQTQISIYHARIYIYWRVGLQSNWTPHTWFK